MSSLPKPKRTSLRIPGFQSLQRTRKRKRNQDTRLEFTKLEDRVVLTAGTGLQAQYYTDTSLTNLALVRTDMAVDFNWGSGSYDAAGPNNQFSARWTGQIESQFTENYSFIVNANDGARLWINGQLLIDQFSNSSVVNATATIDLIAGRKYDIQMEFRENTGAASAKLEWSSNSLAREVIPTERLYPANRGSITNEFWTVAGTNVSDLTSDPDFPDNPNGANTFSNFESPNNSSNNYGRKVSGYLYAPETGPYTFYVAANDSAELWLSNSTDPDEKQLIASVTSSTGIRQWDASASQESNAVYLVAGQKYYVEGLHKEGAGADHFAVGWRKPGEIDVEVIGGEHLAPNRPSVKVFSNVPNAAEGSTAPSKYTIVREGGSNVNALTVNYQLSGEATNGVDYQSLSGTITIPAGSDSVSLDITAVADSLTEAAESVVVEVLSSANYDVGFKSERTAYGSIQDDAPAPPGGTGLVAGTSLGDFLSFGGTFTTESDPIQGNVIQAVITASAQNPFNAQLKQNISGAVNQGDLLLAEFRARSVGGDGTIAAVFEQSSSPYTKSLVQAIPLNDDWIKVQIPFSAAETYAAGEASFGFFLGYPIQTVRLTDIQVINYGAPKTLSSDSPFFLNNIGGNFGVSQSVSVTGQPFLTAYEVETQTVPPQFWHLQTVARNKAPVANGEMMRLEFSIRATSGASPQASIFVQRTDNFSTLHSQNINLTSNWQTFSIDVPADDNYDIDGLQTVFNLGYGLQTVEIGGFKWTNQDNAFDLDELPSQFPASTYTGRGASDAWRDDAETRIDDERKSDVTINVTDANGNPLPGAVINLRQTDHGFKFGTAINAFGGKLDTNGNAQALTYQSEIERLFNTVVIENSLKWPSYADNPQRAVDAVDWAEARDFYIRGHNLIWPSRNVMPESVWTEYDNRVANNGTASANAWLTTTIESHFDDILNQFDGQIPEWDVVNEPWSNHDVMDLLGDSIVVDWFQRVRDFDPSIQLALNDFGIFANNGSNTGHRDNFEYWLGLLNNAGLLDVIGEQSHYDDASLTDISVFGQLVNTYNTQFNAPIVISEFDVNTSDEQLQADYLRDYMTMAFSQSAVTEFLHWGFWESSHWLPDAALYRSDFSIKPNGQAYEDLVFGNWWTDVQATTFDGSAVINAFIGEYDVVVQYNGQTYNGTVTVDGSGNSSVTINVPTQPVNYDPLLAVDNASVNGNVATVLNNTGVWVEPQHDTVSLSASLGSVTQNANGTWSWSFTPLQRFTNQIVDITAVDTDGGSTTVSFTINALTNITDRGITYGGSTQFAQTTIPSDKVALLPGQTATFANYTSYSKGINRVAIDIAGVASSSLAASDFEFRVGNTDDPTTWTQLTSSTSIPLPTVTVSAPVGGISQVLLTWPDNAIDNAWLQVVVGANANTGLTASDTFYFGNAIGETGDNPSNTRVNLIDVGLTRSNQSGFSTVPITNNYDFNRDGRVNLIDVGLARANQTGFTSLNLISPPANRAGEQSDGKSSNSRSFAEEVLAQPFIPTALPASYFVELGRAEQKASSPMTAPLTDDDTTPVVATSIDSAEPGVGLGEDAFCASPLHHVDTEVFDSGIVDSVFARELIADFDSLDRSKLNR